MDLLINIRPYWLSKVTRKKKAWTILIPIHQSRISSIRMLIAIVAIHNLEIHKMNLKTAFLNGDLNEEIYMEQPEGFIVPG